MLFLLAAPFVFAYLFGGFGAGSYLLFKYLQLRVKGENPPPWKVMMGIGWAMFIGGLVVGLGIVPFLHEPHKPYYPTTMAAICNVSIMFSFGVWLKAFSLYRKRAMQLSKS